MCKYSVAYDLAAKIQEGTRGDTMCREKIKYWMKSDMNELIKNR